MQMRVERLAPGAGCVFCEVEGSLVSGEDWMGTDVGRYGFGKIVVMGRTEIERATRARLERKFSVVPKIFSFCV
jgi:hypothetical protein